MQVPAPDVERRVLALLERLLARPGDARYRRRLLRRESAAVLARLTALEAATAGGVRALPTELPFDHREATPPLPARVGAFRLVAPLGAGGMGEVWRAERDDGLYQQVVAIKFLYPYLKRWAGDAFERERQLLARLEHPNIARLIDGGVTEDGRPWLMTEFVDGLPIDEVAASHSRAACVELVIRAAAALQFAHSRLVAHGDIKPSNILIDRDGRVKLLDFGIGGSVADATAAGLSGAMTPAFASLQRQGGEGASIADDIHALGRTMDLLAALRGDRELSAIAAKATAPDPAQRYDSVALLIADLERWREHLPVSAIAPHWHYRAERFVSRHRLGVGLAGLAVVALVGLSLLTTWQGLRAERARADAEQRFADVRALARYQLFDLYDQLRSAPGTVAIRADLAARSAEYLHRLDRDAEAPVALRLETAAGYRRLAQVQGLSGASSLGDPAAAAQSLLRAESLLQALLREQPDRVDALELLGWVYADRWTLLANNAESPAINAIARAQFAAALRLDPGRSGARFGDWVTRKSEAYDLVTGADDLAGALNVLNAVLDEMDAAPLDDSHREAGEQLRVRVLRQRGDVTYYRDDPAAALGDYLQAKAIVDGALRANPTQPDWLNLRGDLAFDISGTLTTLGGRDQEALDVVTQGLEAVLHVLEFGPDANAQKKQVMLLGQQALVHASMGQHDAAVMASSQSLDIREARLASAPADPARVRDVAIAATAHAEFLSGAGRQPEACHAAQRATAAWTLLHQRGQLGQRDAARNRPQARALHDTLCPS